MVVIHTVEWKSHCNDILAIKKVEIDCEEGEGL